MTTVRAVLENDIDWDSTRLGSTRLTVHGQGALEHLSLSLLHSAQLRAFLFLFALPRREPLLGGLRISWVEVDARTAGGSPGHSWRGKAMTMVSRWWV